MCKYHKIFKCGSEVMKINLTTSSDSHNIYYHVKNKGTVPICDKVVIYSERYGMYNKKLEDPVFPDEIVTIVKSNPDYEYDEATAFVKVPSCSTAGTSNWVMSNTLAFELDNWWQYGVTLGFGNAAEYVLFIFNSAISRVTAENVKVVIRLHDYDGSPITPIFSSIDRYSVDKYTLTLYIDRIEPGTSKQFAFRGNYDLYIGSDKAIITSDTRFRKDLTGITKLSF